MSHDIRKRIHLIYGILFSAVTVVAGICFILACYGIYTDGKAAGGQIYSRAIVAEAFAPIAVPVYLCLALVIGGFILHLLLPVESKRIAPEKNRQLILQRLQAKTDLSACDAQLQKDIRKQRSARKLHCFISAALLSVASIGFLIYACNNSLWPEVGQVSPVVLHTFMILAGCLVIPTGYTVFTAYHNRRSLDKEITLMKQAAKLAPSPVAAPVQHVGSQKWLVIARCAIVMLALVLVLYGFFTGGVADVIGKAAKICTECVGLG